MRREDVSERVKTEAAAESTSQPTTKFITQQGNRREECGVWVLKHQQQNTKKAMNRKHFFVLFVPSPRLALLLSLRCACNQ